jgi:hypothetical protein
MPAGKKHTHKSLQPAILQQIARFPQATFHIMLPLLCPSAISLALALPFTSYTPEQSGCYPRAHGFNTCALHQKL